MTDKSYEILHQRKSSFNHSNWDTFDYLGILDYSQALRDRDDRCLQREGRPITQDAFFALSGLEPDASDPLGKTWQQVISTPEFRDLRERASRSYTDTVVATINLSRQMERAIENARHEERVKQNSSNPAITNPHSAQLPLPPLEDVLARSIQEGEEGIPVDVAYIAQADEETEGQAAFVESVSGSLEGSPGMKLDRALSLASLVDVKEFAKLLGWAQRVVSGAARTHRGGTEELTGYKRNGWTPNTVATEMLAVADGDTVALGNLADNNLTNREYRSNKPAGKGPVILLRDESYSMGGHQMRNRHQRALAFELALASAFNREGRDLVCIRFDNGFSEPYTYGEPGLEQHLSSFRAGGTDPVPALQRALEVADEYVTGADILILTDGAFAQSVESSYVMRNVDAFRRSGGRVWGLAIGSERSQATQYLGFTDGWIDIDEIKGGEALGELVAKMANRDANGQRRRAL